MLPDDVLLEIFDFYVDEDSMHEDWDEDNYFGPFEERIKEWETLAHVCRRWRRVVFQSPRRLNLPILCTDKTPARYTLDIWSPLPLVIRVANHDEPSRADNIIAALEHNDRVCQINVECLTNSQLGCVTDSAAMQKPFPKLTHLGLAMIVHDNDGSGPIFSDSFLGGNAPGLQSIVLWDVSFPRLPKLLLSATHLVALYLFNIPRSGTSHPRRWPPASRR
jgi:F-box-like